MDYLKTPTLADIQWSTLKTGYVTFGLLVIVWDLLALMVIIRSKTPKFAKFLSTFLIVFETGMLTLWTVDHFTRYSVSFAVTDLIVNLRMTLSMLAFVTVGMMSSDRLYMVTSPLKYYKMAVLTSTKRVYAVIIWSIVAMIILAFKNGVCKLMPYRECFRILIVFYFSSYFSIIVLSVGCYIVTYRSIVAKRRGIRTSKTTNLLFLYLIPTVITFCLLVGGVFGLINRSTFNAGLDASHFLNSIFDPLLYVVWFKECQWEILNIIGYLFPSVKDSARQMQQVISKVKRPYLKKCVSCKSLGKRETNNSRQINVLPIDLKYTVIQNGPPSIKQFELSSTHTV